MHKITLLIKCLYALCTFNASLGIKVVSSQSLLRISSLFHLTLHMYIYMMFYTGTKCPPPPHPPPTHTHVHYCSHLSSSIRRPVLPHSQHPTPTCFNPDHIALPSHKNNHWPHSLCHRGKQQHAFPWITRRHPCFSVWLFR